MHRARRVLDITVAESTRLFYGSNTAQEISYAVDAILERKRSS